MNKEVAKALSEAIEFISEALSSESKEKGDKELFKARSLISYALYQLARDNDYTTGKQGNQ